MSFPARAYSQPYLHPIRRARSSITYGSHGYTSTGPGQAGYSDNFPSLHVSPSIDQCTSAINNNNNAISFSHLICEQGIGVGSTPTLHPGEEGTRSLPVGWVEITSRDARDRRSTRRRCPGGSNLNPSSSADDFLQRIHGRDKYMNSLDDTKYASLCNDAMNKVVSIYRRHKSEFIEIYGYDYYDKIYGYKPVYGRRTIYRPASNKYVNYGHSTHANTYMNMNMNTDTDTVPNTTNTNDADPETEDAGQVNYMEYYIDDDDEMDGESGRAACEDAMDDEAFDDYD